MTKKVYFENLDGLRFLCFLSVFFFHSFHTDYASIQSSNLYHFIRRDLFGNGNLGVNFFFVLSGFLITYLLIEEKRLNGQIDIKKFWIRRILRIWPLFYFCVVFGFYIFPFLKTAFGQHPNETASIGYYLTFTNNFDFIKKGLPDASILGVLWSVAIEEQFYFVWPIVL
jgi:peptidoglycan/LPS O-acetylase OafA/YrhL